MYICNNCREECEIIEETFDYPAAHCTYGKLGTYYTGNYVSKCCLDEFIDDSIESTESNHPAKDGA